MLFTKTIIMAIAPTFTSKSRLQLHDKLFLFCSHPFSTSAGVVFVLVFSFVGAKIGIKIWFYVCSACGSCSHLFLPE